MNPISCIGQLYVTEAIYVRRAMPTPLMLDSASSEMPCAAFPSDSIPRLNPYTNTNFLTTTLQTLKTVLLLLIPSNTQVLSTGTYCSVIALMISCETIPPVKAPMLCSSAPPARTLGLGQPTTSCCRATTRPSKEGRLGSSSEAVYTYSSRAYSPICDLMVAYSSSSMEAFASFTRSFAILNAIPVSFSESASGSLSPATRGAPPRPS
jgi:hypothetical protein